jgi:hypothetical protein
VWSSYSTENTDRNRARLSGLAEGTELTRLCTVCPEYTEECKCITNDMTRLGAEHCRMQVYHERHDAIRCRNIGKCKCITNDMTPLCAERKSITNHERPRLCAEYTAECRRGNMYPHKNESDQNFVLLILSRTRSIVDYSAGSYCSCLRVIHRKGHSTHFYTMRSSDYSLSSYLLRTTTNAFFLFLLILHATC